MAQDSGNEIEGSRSGTISLDRLKEAKVSISITLLCVMVATGFSSWKVLNPTYEQWHRDEGDKRWVQITVAEETLALKTDVLGHQKANDIRADVAQASMKAQTNTRKLDEQSVQITQLSTDFNTYAATTLVYNTSEELRRHIEQNLNTPAWRNTRSMLEQRLSDAKDYQKCVIDGRVNCHLLMPR